MSWLEDVRRRDKTIAELFESLEIQTPMDLRRWSEADLSNLFGVGPRKIQRIYRCIRPLGFGLKGDPPLMPNQTTAWSREQAEILHHLAYEAELSAMALMETAAKYRAAANAYLIGCVPRQDGRHGPYEKRASS